MALQAKNPTQKKAAALQIQSMILIHGSFPSHRSFVCGFKGFRGVVACPGAPNAFGTIRRDGWPKVEAGLPEQPKALLGDITPKFMVHV